MASESDHTDCLPPDKWGLEDLSPFAKLKRRVSKSRTWFRARGIIANSSRIYQYYARCRYPSQTLHSDTELLVEGYCRSGVAFFAEAVMWAQKRPMKVAWGIHSPGAVIASIRTQVPRIVMMRKPDEVAVSQKVINPFLDFRDILNGYLRYHKKIQPYADQCVLASIYEIRKDLGTVIQRINDRFGTTFLPFEHTEENEAAVYEWMNEKMRARHGGVMPRREQLYSGYPSKEREALRRRVLERFCEDLTLLPLRTEALDIYTSLLSGSPSPE